MKIMTASSALHRRNHEAGCVLRRLHAMFGLLAALSMLIVSLSCVAAQPATSHLPATVAGGAGTTQIAGWKIQVLPSSV